MTSGRGAETPDLSKFSPTANGYTRQISTKDVRHSCRTSFAETARRFVSLNILLSHSRSLKVIRNEIAE